ncbi:MAG: tRNA preQ1(34) S-adenosylmethionine ribosyltransferase-isomerase QueA [Gammaproteobacteria bacterium]|nr:tRNA preQ1(34) S-adenosylmethionine ribosyltransferase-isomerase QueA [Gammaproteobacteria bacterium]
MERRDFFYDLPPDLIAKVPTPERSGARLLVLDPAHDGVLDRRIRDLPELVAPDDLLVFNDTRVIPARLFGRKTSGGRIEILIERVIGADRAAAHLRASKAPKPGGRIVLDGGPEVVVVDRDDEGLFFIETLGGATWESILAASGQVPLPPYIDREPTAEDVARYQTVYARAGGAVAAPTAGLHFDEALLAAVAARGAHFAYTTLHVGAGTFRSVRAERLAEHRMHAEYVEVSDEVCSAVAATRARGGRVVAIGTTSVRALETAAAAGALAPYRGDTRLFIHPGYRFRVVDALLTNFHLPESTLLMLVSAFAGRERVLAAYRHAIAGRYRFFSYGDAMWVLPAAGARQAG